MSEYATRFAHGQYGDLSGVVFSATLRGTTHRLPISDRFITPIFSAMLTHKYPPRPVEDWNADRGWVQAVSPVRLHPAEVDTLHRALVSVTREELEGLCHGVTPGECMRCAVEISSFLDAHVINGWTCFIERD